MSIDSQIAKVRTDERVFLSAQSRRTNWLWRHSRLAWDLAILLLFAAFVRLPYFIRTVIDWDESTFILMADSLLNGHLPQTELSALKPPFAYVPYACFLLLFGQTIAAVRLGGLLCVFAASTAIYLTCRRRFGASGALAAGTCVSAFATVDLFCGGTMLEHIALVPLSLVVLTWSDRSPTAVRSFWIGTLIGLAAALKTNLAGFALAPLCLLASQIPHLGWKDTARAAAMLLIGVSLPQVTSALVYWLSGNFDLWWRSCVATSFSYVAHNAQTLESHIPSLCRKLTNANPAGFVLAWILPLLGLVIACAGKSKFSQERAFLIAMAAFCLSGLATAGATGLFHIRHHFVVLVPFTVAMSGFALHMAFSCRRRILYALVTFSLLLLSLSPVAREYANVWRVVVNRQQTDTAYKVAEYLNGRNVYGQYVYFTSWHIGYWMTGAKIPTRFVHPSDIGKPHFLKSLYRSPTDSITELKRIFEKKPVYVVARLDDEQIRGDAELKRAFENELRWHYALETIIDDAGVFRRTGS